MVGQRAARDLEDSAVQKWFSRLRPRSGKTYAQYFPEFMDWIRSHNAELANITPTRLLEFHRANKARKPTRKIPNPEYIVVDWLKEWIDSQREKYTFKSLQLKKSAVESFFTHNRAPLPKDPSYEIKAGKPPVQGTLDIATVNQIINAAHNLRDKSWLMMKWQGLLDTAGLAYVNMNLGKYIADEIHAGKNIIRLDIAKGRKGSTNMVPYHTFIGKDTIALLKQYFEQQRPNGYPKAGEPIWINKMGNPIREEGGFVDIELGILRGIGLIPKKGKFGARYGKNLHEFRDVAISYLHTKAASKGLDMDCVQYWSGHFGKLDPNKYDKFFRDKEFMFETYTIAEPYLNLLSNPNGLAREKITKEINDRIKELLESGEWRELARRSFEEEYGEKNQ